MRTVAQKYIEEGEVRGKSIGIQIGEARGEARLVKTMIQNGSSIEEVCRMTKLSITKIRELLKINT